MHLPHCPFIITMTTISTQSTNRTVFTFVGDPTSVVEAALAAAKVMMNMIVIVMIFIIIITDVIGAVIINVIFNFVP